MKKKIVQCLFIIIAFSGLYLNSYYDSHKYFQAIEINENLDTTQILLDLINEADVSIEPSNVSTVGESEENVEINSEPLIFPDSYYNPEIEEYREEEFWDDMELVALVCVAEAEGESEYGKRLVIDSIFNRLDSEYFPSTIYEVVHAPGQYECVTNGRINYVEYDEYIANLVLEELQHRTNSEVIYFRTNYYFDFGTPLLNEGSHYFSGR